MEVKLDVQEIFNIHYMDQVWFGWPSDYPDHILEKLTLAQSGIPKKVDLIFKARPGAEKVIKGA